MGNTYIAGPAAGGIAPDVVGKLVRCDPEYVRTRIVDLFPVRQPGDFQENFLNKILRLMHKGQSTPEKSQKRIPESLLGLMYVHHPSLIAIFFIAERKFADILSSGSQKSDGTFDWAATRDAHPCLFAIVRAIRCQASIINAALSTRRGQ